MPPEPQTEQQPQPTPQQPGPRSRAEIAREMFGNEFFDDGKPEAEPAEGPKPSPEPKSGDTQPDEEPPVTEEPTEGEEIREPEGGEPQAPDEAEGETPIAHLSELIQHYEPGIDLDYVNSLKVPVTVDGTPTEATIGDLVKSYQIIEAAEHRLSDAKAVAQREQEALAAKNAETEGHYRVAAELIKSAEATLERDIKAVDPKLRDEDPAEWAARREEFAERRGFIEKMKRDTVAGYQTFQQTQAAEVKQKIDAFTAEQAVILLQKLPEWQDAKRAETEKTELADYLIRQGFAQQELAGLIDHRHVLLARKAMLYDKSRGQVETAKKRVAKVPKVMKPGAPKPAEQRATEKLAALKAKMQRTGSPEDALAYRLAKRGT